MSTFRSALRVAWRHPVYLVSYLAILSLMSVLVGRLVADQAAAAPSSYEPVRASVAVVDEDGSDLSRALASWAGGRFELVETNGTQEVQDALARSLVDCVLVLPQGFGQELLNAARTGDDLPNVRATYGADVQTGVLAAQEASQWVSLAGSAAVLEPDAGACAVGELATQAMGQRADVATLTNADAGDVRTTAGATTYFNFSAYPIMSSVVVTVGLVLSVFSESEVRRRQGCAPVSPARLDASLLGGCLVLALGAWAWTSVLGLAVFADELSDVPAANLALLLVAQLAISLTPLSLAFTLSRLGLREQGLNAAGNIGGMVLTFLGGAWVPLSLMSEEVRTVAHFVPTYWVSDAVTTLLGASALTASDLARVGTDIGVATLFAVAIAALGLALSRARRA